MSSSRSPLRLGGVSPSELPSVDGEAAQVVREDMVWLTGGLFSMGSEDDDAILPDAEGPVRQVEVAPFGISPTAVTNHEFDLFVAATGYQTEAERFGWSFVFHLLAQDVPPEQIRGVAGGTPWWLGVDGADWKHPEGSGSTVKERLDHPVVHVSHHDALAYCAWTGTRLPTEKEWEYAARGGLESKRFPWGDELTPGGEHMCNIFQGQFPQANTAEDGFLGTAPARTFAPNGFDLYQMSGNVWEWTATVWEKPGGIPSHHRAPRLWVIRGGSYLCHASYCNRYRVAARTSNTSDSSMGNTGFRVVAS